MIREPEVKEKLAALRRDELPLEEFERWIVPASWNMHSDSSSDAVELVSSIHELFSLRDDLVLSVSDLRHALVSLVQEPIEFRVSFIVSAEKVSPLDLRKPVASASLRPFVSLPA